MKLILSSLLTSKLTAQVCRTLTESDELSSAPFPKLCALNEAIGAAHVDGQPDRSQVLVCVSARGQVSRVAAQLAALSAHARVGAWLPRPPAGSRSARQAAQPAKDAKRALQEFEGGVLDVLVVPSEEQWPEGPGEGPRTDRVGLLALFDAWARLPLTLQTLASQGAGEGDAGANEGEPSSPSLKVATVLKLRSAGAEAVQAAADEQVGG